MKLEILELNRLMIDLYDHFLLVFDIKEFSKNMWSYVQIILTFLADNFYYWDFILKHLLEYENLKFQAGMVTDKTDYKITNVSFCE